MVKELLYKWFGLDPIPYCASCEVLRAQLDESNRERKQLLQVILDKDRTPVETTREIEPQPLKPSFVPWRVRQQMFEAEDRKKAQLMREKSDEIRASKINELEKELGVEDGTGTK